MAAQLLLVRRPNNCAEQACVALADWAVHEVIPLKDLLSRFTPSSSSAGS